MSYTTCHTDSKAQSISKDSQNRDFSPVAQNDKSRLLLFATQITHPLTPSAREGEQDVSHLKQRRGNFGLHSASEGDFWITLRKERDKSTRF
ncbi:hypothetical protein [Campylobacter troglodytis]|uniref:hypothetical protein n=1 Tax=Campylobacter troglodytis TaxID=654363 RepID=UPI00115A6C6B|nr:hypothetical protein [Campylobacter troglodytis]TQR60778.1 hypothetical protein DMC01_03970 [Campylobacter troglodytis]